jgi:hypothetical protein
MRSNRRLVLAAPVLLLLVRPGLSDASAIGTTVSLAGKASLGRASGVTDLHPADPLMEGDSVTVAPSSTAVLELFTATMINLGPEAKLVLDRFTAELGGTITVGGPLVFDRAEDLPKLDLTVQNAFAQIGVRGTRFFAGPSKGVYGVFVARGAVEVTAAGETRRLGPGDGVDIAAPGAAPSPVARWKAPRIAAAFASVGLTP